MDYMDGKKWWPMPKLGNSKLRSRKIYLDTGHVGHPARMNPLWAQRMIQEYSKPGDTILDPMAGTGTTGIEAARLGRNAILVDCEGCWVRQMQTEVKRLRKSGQMRGSIKVLKANATQLELPEKPKVIMFSPPYELAMNGAGVNYFDQAKTVLSTKESFGNVSGVFKNCRTLLSLGSLMIINGKNSVKNQTLQASDTKTIKLVEDAGFKLVKRINVKAAPSFFRNIQEQRNPKMPHIRHEYFLVFKAT